jgi:putative lipoic acid-binding regulatory protein
MTGQVPSIELLESTHKFPCVFTFKAIGLTSNDFVDRVLAAVKHELKTDVDPPYSSRVTAGVKHTSVTIEPTVTSAEQVIAIYHRIHAVEGIVMMM